MADASAALLRAAHAGAEAEQARAEIGAERERLIAEARASAQAEKANLLALASQETAKLREDAKSAIAGDRMAAEQAILARASDLAVDIARRLLERLPPKVVQSAFLDGICRELRALSAEDREDFASVSATDHAIVVITAQALCAEETGSVRDALRAALGAEVPFEFRADPALIAGLEIHGRNAIMRNHWREDLDQSARSLGVTNIPLDLEHWLTDARERVRAATLAPVAEQIGRVEAVADGIATVSGLAGVRVNELVRFRHRQVGFALTLDENSIGCVLLDDIEGVEAGHRVTGTGEIVRVPVGPGLLGRTVDPLGRALDAGGTIDAEGFEPVERPAPAIIERDFVTEPVQTGLLVIDSMFALGRGQRELIIGDRAIGKTAIAVDASSIRRPAT